MRELWRVRVEWMPQDAIVGVFWRRMINCFDVYIFLVPCIAIHFSRWMVREDHNEDTPCGDDRGESCRGFVHGCQCPECVHTEEVGRYR